MIQIYADGALVYDSRLEDYSLAGLKVTGGLNKGGTAEITLPHGHPSYYSFTGYRTIVTIYRDGELRFRGRALYPVNDYNNNRTIMCEGELCFLLDAVSRPYLYQDSPANIFTALVGEYNAQVDAFKRFTVGSINVTDPNDYVRLESEEAESVLDTVNKLLERCGGYIEFTTNEDTGARVINWLTTVGSQSGQTVEAGENMFDFSSSDANTDLATALVPYGAKDETTGKRLTVTSVNGGKDYIVDETAAALRGIIVKTATWDDVTDPNNLLTKARQHLNEVKLVVTSLVLTALDLSYIDKSVDSFKLGDLIRVISRAHGVDENFQLVEYSDDLLNPGSSYITLGKEIRTLTGLDVAGDAKGQSDISKATSAIKKDFEVNVQHSINAALESDATVQKLTSIISQQAGKITMETSGSLGSKAQIKLSAFGQVQTAELDLEKIREAFANDTSAVEISGGTIAFNSNTLIVNSTNFKVTEDGTITATNAVLSGTATTENGLYKSELSAGRLRFFYDGVEYGGIASGYMEGDTSTRGVTVRLSAESKYVGFSRYNTETELNDIYYCINFGANIGGRTERHMFFGTSYFAEQITVNGPAYINNSLSTKGHVNLDGAYSFNCKTSQGSYINGLGLSADDQLVVGALSNNLYLYGANVYIGGNDSGLVQIQGASAQVTSPFTFYDTATFNGAVTYAQLATFNNAVKYNGNAFFANEKGVALYRTDGKTVFAMTIGSDNKVYVGSQDAPMVVFGSTTQLGGNLYPTTITGSTVSITNSVSISGVATFNNGYGIRIKDAAGTAQYLLSLNSSNQVSVGNASYQLYLRGTGVSIPSGGVALGDGSVILANGYGLVIKDSGGTSQYVLSLTSGNMVNVGCSSYVTYLRGTAVYLASSGATVTSDERKKNSIEALPDAYEAMLDKLTPVRYKYNDGNSGRYHAGFRAQDVKAALEAAGLTTSDFGGFVDLNGDGEELGLIYSEFIAILLQKIKRQEQRIAALEEARI